MSVVGPTFESANRVRADALHEVVAELCTRLDVNPAYRLERIPTNEVFIADNQREFRHKLARSAFYQDCTRKLRQAYMFADGATHGLGGDAFQTFLATNAEWSALVHGRKTHSARAASLEDYEKHFGGQFATRFTTLLLPVHSPFEELAVLLFERTEDGDSMHLAYDRDIQYPAAAAKSLLPSLDIIYLACVVRLLPHPSAASNETTGRHILADIRKSLATAAIPSSAPATIRAQCERLPRQWLFGEGPHQAGLRPIDCVDIVYEHVAAFGKHARFHYVTHAFLDGKVFDRIDAALRALTAGETTQ